MIVRDGSEKKLDVTLEEANPDKVARAGGGRDDSTGESDDKAALGVAVAPITQELRDRTRVPRNAQGLLVEDVNPDGRAALAGIQPGDVIQEVNRHPVRTVDDLRAALKKSADRPTLVLINRQGNDLFLTVRPSNG